MQGQRIQDSIIDDLDIVIEEITESKAQMGMITTADNAVVEELKNIRDRLSKYFDNVGDHTV
ncbi:MAG: hypothetical protein CMB80_00125 [Flammeovirgaceae bacterium]|jgi:hypothetical protein|nr:hypothetical protein [Flammeovirgaceae bacterium]|tara:strand:+ start:672 stop:857 length:186 start_codon:yes stop_codon:yes gene_type:complete